MKKINTVKKHAEFDALVHGGKRLRSPHFTFFFEKSELGYTRIGISVGKKNGGAVTRVRIKRQVRAMIASRGDLTLSMNLIIAVRPDFIQCEFHELEKELNESFDRIKELLN